MKKIMFVCHGNICRSPMAEFVMTDMVNKLGISENFYISSSATSTEEIGNPVHRGTLAKLKEYNIPVYERYAVQLKKSDYDKYDFIIAMDSANLRNIFRIIKEDKKNKVHKILDFTDEHRDVADPWYTGNFEITFCDICKGCTGLIKYLTGIETKLEYNKN